jgi:hypothetical protein
MSKTFSVQLLLLSGVCFGIRANFFLRFNLYTGFKCEKDVPCKPLKGKLNKQMLHIAETLKRLVALYCILHPVVLYTDWGDLSLPITEKYNFKTIFSMVIT